MKKRLKQQIMYQKKGIIDFATLKEVSFEIKEEKVGAYAASLTPNQNGQVWISSKKRREIYQHFENNWPYNGQTITVAFFSSDFDSGFDERVHHVTFDLAQYKNASGATLFKAVHINNADSVSEALPCLAAHIRPGNVPSNRVINGYCYFLFHTLYFGGKSVFDSDCPEALRSAFEQAKDEWIRVYHKCNNPGVQAKIFNLMSLAAGDLGDSYYRIANERIAASVESGNYRTLPDYIGYALLNYTNNREKQLWEQLQYLPDEKVVCILSKAVWGTADFILNFPIEATLRYFDAAIEYADIEINVWKKNMSSRKHAAFNLHMYFEYILGVFRLRQKSDAALRKRLSMNNKTMQKLYDLIECTIKNNIPISTFLKLSIKDKKQYKNIPDLLYALLVYITGYEENDSIIISGVDFSDD